MGEGDRTDGGFGIFSQERFQHSLLSEVLAAMPVGKIEMGFIDITMRTLVFWIPSPPPPAGRDCKIPSTADEGRFAFLSTQPLLFIFHFE